MFLHDMTLLHTKVVTFLLVPISHKSEKLEVVHNYERRLLLLHTMLISHM